MTLYVAYHRGDVGVGGVSAAHVHNIAEETSHNNLTEESFARGESGRHCVGTEGTLACIGNHAVEERSTEDRTHNLSTYVGQTLDQVAMAGKEERKSNGRVQVAARDMANRVGKNHDGHTEGKGGINTETGVDGDDVSQCLELLVKNGSGVTGIVVSTGNERTFTDGTKADSGTAADEHKEHHTCKH
jgi:hypothetical protein